MAPLIDGFAAGSSGGGSELGRAHGSITLDIADLLNAEKASKSVGRNIESNLNSVGRASDDASKSLNSLGREVSSIKKAATTAKLDSLGRDVAAGNKSVQQAAVEYRAFRDALKEVEEQARRTATESRTLASAVRSGISRAQSLLTSFRTEIAAVGAAGALTTVFGLNASRDIRNARIRLSQFVSTEEEAAELMRSLTDSANEFGLNLEGVFSLASSLLPVLEGNVEATDEWVKRAARLRTVLPTAQQGAELRAISEFLAGQTISLQRLFNIPPNLILEAKAAFSDAGDQLDFILERMGATEQAARDMADPIVAVRNELKLIAATGFDPILQRLREILPEVREWLERIRETRPEVLEIGAAFAAAAAIGAPFLLFLGQALSTAQKLQQLGVLGSLGRVGAAGLIIGGAAIGTTAGVNALTREGAPFENKRLEDAGFFKIMAEGLKAMADLFFGFVSLLGPVFQEINRSLINFAQVVIAVYTGLGTILSKIGSVLPDDLGGRELSSSGSAIERAGESAGEFVRQLKQANEESLPAFRERVQESRDAIRNFIDGLFTGGGAGGPDGKRGGGAGGKAGPGGLTELQLQQLAAWEEYQAQIAAIEQRGQEQRLRLTEQYEAQRTSIIAQYEKQAAREAAAFARNRAREIARTQDEIDDIRGEALSQEAEWWQELQDVIANARAESARRIAEIEADANRTREQNERTHRDNLLSAASRLDARAVADEQRRFRTQSANFEQDLQARLEKERQNLAERIAAEEQGHAERIAAERASNEERIQAILEAQAERFAIEDEERAIRLEEQKQDHLEQLAELRKANRKRLEESKQQQKKELDQLEKQFEDSNREFSDYYTKWLTTQKDEQKASLDEWDNFWKEWWRVQQAQMTTAGAGTGGTGTGTGGTPGGGTGAGGTGGETPLTRSELERLFGRLATEAGWTNRAILEFIGVSRNWTDRQLALWIEANFGYDVPGYKQGTPYVPKDQLAYLHKGEAVLKEADASVWRMLLSAFGGRQMAASYATTSNRMNVNMTFNGLGGASAGDIGDVVEKRMLQVFKRIP